MYSPRDLGQGLVLRAHHPARHLRVPNQRRPLHAHPVHDPCSREGDARIIAQVGTAWINSADYFYDRMKSTGWREYISTPKSFRPGTPTPRASLARAGSRCFSASRRCGSPLRPQCLYLPASRQVDLESASSCETGETGAGNNIVQSNIRPRLKPVLLPNCNDLKQFS